MPDKITLNGKNFKKFIPQKEINKVIETLAIDINADRYHSQNDLVVIPVLTGSMLFAADLVRCLDGVTAIYPVKYKSYSGTESTGNVSRTFLFPLDELEGKDVLIVEDIIDKGLTVETILNDLKPFKPASIKICTLLYKPKAFKGNYEIDYHGFEIGNEFVVGYGMDYDEAGRNLRDIYVLDESQS